MNSFQMLDTIITVKNRLSPGSQKIISNTGWLISEKVFRMGVGLVVGVWVARYLGPDQFGILNYAIAFVALANPFAVLGLHGIIVRDIVRTPADQKEIMGTTFILRLVGGGLSFAITLLIVAMAHRSQDQQMRYMVGIIAISLIFRAFDTINLWFQSEVQSKYAVYAQSTALMLGAVVKVVLILVKAPLIAFAWEVLAEYVIIAFGLVVAYYTKGHTIGTWRFNLHRAKNLLTQSWPLFLSSIGAIINLDIDRVMLGKMAGAEEVGIYSAAVRLAEVWYFLPAAIASSAFPALVRSKKIDESVYNARLQRLYDYTLLAALAVIVVVSPAAYPIIKLLYGPEYLRSAPILALHIWACLFIFMGEILSKWLINEGLLKFSLIRHGAGAVVNIVLNLFLIPRYGGFGAAMATIISYATAAWFICFIHPLTRSAGKMMSTALIFPIRLGLRRRETL